MHNNKFNKLDLVNLQDETLNQLIKLTDDAKIFSINYDIQTIETILRKDLTIEQYKNIYNSLKTNFNGTNWHMLNEIVKSAMGISIIL